MLITLDIAEKAGYILLNYFKKKIKIKFKEDRFDPVTMADRKSDSFIRKSLQKRFPNDEILSEESSSLPRSYKGRVWMVDPLDGTKNFLKGKTDFAVIIALVENGDPILGCVALPAKNKIYIAEKNKGSYKKTKTGFTRLKTSFIKDISNAVCITRVPTEEIRPIENAIKKISFKKFIINNEPKPCMIAKGVADTHINTNSKVSKWDVAAQQLILEEAGGIITDMSGAPINYKSKESKLLRSYVASATKELHKKVISKLKKIKGF
jgi:3'(2'),5'-bisphosphate nucleotidase